jgi:hypothetical protein
MNATTIFSAPCFEAVLNALYEARDAAQDAGDQAMAIAYDLIAQNLNSGMHNARILDLEEWQA